MSELEKEVERLQGRVGQLRGDLHETDKKLREAKVRFATEIYGVAVGSIVRSRDGEFRVTIIDASWVPKMAPSLAGNARKKNGEFGAAVRNVYGKWELVKP